MVTFQQTDFLIPNKINITINEVFNRESFIKYEEFCEKICPIHENSYLALKSRLVTIFKLPGKYPPPNHQYICPRLEHREHDKALQIKKKGLQKIEKDNFSRKESWQ